MAAHGVGRGFMNAASPGVISLFLQNAHYPDRAALSRRAGRMRMRDNEIPDDSRRGPDLQLELFPTPRCRGHRCSSPISAMRNYVARGRNPCRRTGTRASSGLPTDRVAAPHLLGNYEGSHLLQTIDMAPCSQLLMRCPRATLPVAKTANPGTAIEWTCSRDRAATFVRQGLVPARSTPTNEISIENHPSVAQRLERFVDIGRPDRVNSPAAIGGFGTFERAFGAWTRKSRGPSSQPCRKARGASMTPLLLIPHDVRRALWGGRLPERWRPGPFIMPCPSRAKPSPGLGRRDQSRRRALALALAGLSMGGSWHGDAGPALGGSSGLRAGSIAPTRCAGETGRDVAPRGLADRARPVGRPDRADARRVENPNYLADAHRHSHAGTLPSHAEPFGGARSVPAASLWRLRDRAEPRTSDNAGGASIATRWSSWARRTCLCPRHRHGTYQRAGCRNRLSLRACCRPSAAGFETPAPTLAGIQDWLTP